jgi:hypothetical protein
MMHKANFGPASFSAPGLAALCAEFAAPVAVLETLNINTGFAHQFGSEGIDGRLWAVTVTTALGAGPKAVVRTVRSLPVRTAHQDRELLLRETLGNFLLNAEPVDDEGNAAMEAVRAIEAEAIRPGTLVIDGETVDAITCRHHGHTALAAHYRDLVVVVVVPDAEAEGLRIGTITLSKG